MASPATQPSFTRSSSSALSDSSCIAITKAAPRGSGLPIFLVAYLAWRLVIDFLKPQPLIFGLNLIQWACMAGIVAFMPDL